MELVLTTFSNDLSIIWRKICLVDLLASNMKLKLNRLQFLQIEGGHKNQYQMNQSLPFPGRGKRRGVGDNAHVVLTGALEATSCYFCYVISLQ